MARIAGTADRAYLCRMLRFLSRSVGYWLLAAALVAAVVDAAASIAASSVVLTPLLKALNDLLALGGWEALNVATPPWPLDLALSWLLAAPVAAVLAAAGMLFLVAGRRRRRQAFGRAYAA